MRGFSTAKEGRIGWWELAMLIVANKLSMLTTYAPILTAVPATRDAWISAWLAVTASVLITLVPYSLLKHFPGQTVFAVNRRVLGTWLGGLLNLLYALLFLYSAAVAVRMFSEVFVVAMLPETPVWAINVMVAILAWHGTRQGVEGLGRMADLVGPGIVLTVLILAPLDANRMDLSRLLPIFEYGPGPMLLQSLTPIAIFGETAWTVLLIMPYMRRPGETVKAFLVGSAITGFMVSFGAALLIAAMGPALIDLDLFPTVTAVRLIRVAEFLTRVEWLLAALWMGAMYVKLALLFRGVVGALGEGLRLPLRSGVLILLTAGVSVVWAQRVFEDTVALMTHFRPEKWLPPALALQLLFPLLTLTVAWFRRMRGTPQQTGAASG